MTFTSTWTNFAPGLIVCIVLVLAYLTVSRAVQFGGWWRQAHTPVFSPSNGFLALLWLAVYVIYAVAWTMVNTQRVGVVEEIAALSQLNWIFGLGIMLNLIWVMSFYGAGHTAFSLLILLVMVVLATAALVLLRHSVLLVGLISIYLAWLLYLVYLNIYVWRYNRIYQDSFADEDPNHRSSPDVQLGAVVALCTPSDKETERETQTRAKQAR